MRGTPCMLNKVRNMLLRQKDSYIKICMNTWLLCEACIHAENEKLFPKERLLQACQACSSSCLSIVSGFISDQPAIQQHVFRCFLDCRECYNECLQFSEKDIQFCGETSAACAEMMKELLFFHLN